MRRACAFQSQNKVLHRLYTVFQRNGLANLTTTLRALYRRYEYALSKTCNAHNRYRRNYDFGTILMYSASYIHVHTNSTAQKNRENIEFISVFSTLWRISYSPYTAGGRTWTQVWHPQTHIERSLPECWLGVCKRSVNSIKKIVVRFQALQYKTKLHPQLVDLVSARTAHTLTGHILNLVYPYIFVPQKL